ncbi:trafficking protein particle complex subunit 14-like isoform X2 [Dunckerocampus dactyliophorus]|uniref:trafficking protein particle complex subunit 14-like isoform X2 n=1 Tax=Dunckerocampus dactyliophorus TaxID=161453 RepID=UPI0024057ED1|nr:trafficking protein particle complex subunit 14-like isoform X2 [Dunckerocampus dactyliophorus]
MESLFEHFIYFPVSPVAIGTGTEELTTLPGRTSFYLGETVHLLLVLKFRREASWIKLGELFAVASVSQDDDGGGKRRTTFENNLHRSDEDEEDQIQSRIRTFKHCKLLLNHSNERHNMEPVKSTVLSDKQVCFHLSVSLDKLPVSALQAKVAVTVWEQDEDSMEAREHGYLNLLQLYNPMHTFREDLHHTFKTQVNATLKVLPPPSVQCQQMTISGKYVTFLKVLNCSSQEEVCITDVKILPNYNLSYLPIMPDGSVLVVDNVCHQSAEVTMASFYRVDSQSSRLPSMLSTLEEHNFLFRLHLQDKEEEDSSEGLEVPLVAVLHWSTSTLPYTRYISTFYSLPSIRLSRPRLVMSATCPSAVKPLENFWVKYTVLNNLHDFLSIRLVWNLEGHKGGHQGDPMVVCQSPFNNLGGCRKGSTVSFTVAFQILGTGLFEKTSPERTSLGRSVSFSHQQPSVTHHVRTGSMMEYPPSSSSSSTPICSPQLVRGLYVSPPEHSLISLDKVVKRECQVFVLDSR